MMVITFSSPFFLEVTVTGAVSDSFVCLPLSAAHPQAASAVIYSSGKDVGLDTAALQSGSSDYLSLSTHRQRVGIFPRGAWLSGRNRGHGSGALRLRAGLVVPIVRPSVSLSRSLCLSLSLSLFLSLSLARYKLFYD